MTQAVLMVQKRTSCQFSRFLHPWRSKRSCQTSCLSCQDLCLWHSRLGHPCPYLSSAALTGGAKHSPRRFRLGGPEGLFRHFQRKKVTFRFFGHLWRQKCDSQGSQQKTSPLIFLVLLKNAFIASRNAKIGWAGLWNVFLWRKIYVRHEQPLFQIWAFRIEFWEKSRPGMDLICMIDLFSVPLKMLCFVCRWKVQSAKNQ